MKAKKIFPFLMLVSVLSLFLACSDEKSGMQVSASVKTEPSSNVKAMSNPMKTAYLEGYYEFIGDSGAGYMRFYNDGSMIAVTTSGTNREKLLEWFDRDSDSVSVGTYQIEGSTLTGSYDNKVNKGKPISFSGTINSDDSLDLHIISSVNGNEFDRTYILFQGVGLVEADSENTLAENTAAPEKANNNEDAPPSQSEVTAVPEKSGSGKYISDDKRTAKIYKSTDFSEDRAWVQLGDRGDILAIIDTQGQLVVAINYSGQGIPALGSPFKDGLTYHPGVEGKNNNYNAMIIDKNGDITFEAEDENFLILAYGNGKFLAAQHVSSMIADEWQVGAIDKNGNIVMPFTTVTHIVWGNEIELSFDQAYWDGDSYWGCDYIGDNVFKIHHKGKNVFLNIETQTVILEDEEYIDISLITDFENGYATAAGKYLYQIGTDGSVSEIPSNWPPYYNGSIDNISHLQIPAEYNAFAGGLANVDGQYYDILGNMVIDFPEYREKKLSYWGSPFNNGYAVLTINGADGQYYLTLIDKSGNQMFEPIAISNPVTLNYHSWIFTDDGYLIVFTPTERDAICYSVLDTSGNLLMKFYFPKSIYKGTDKGINISGGMLLVPSAGNGSVYVSMADGSIIGSYNKNEFSVE